MTHRVDVNFLLGIGAFSPEKQAQLTHEWNFEHDEHDQHKEHDQHSEHHDHDNDDHHHHQQQHHHHQQQKQRFDTTVGTVAFQMEGNVDGSAVDDWFQCLLWENKYSFDAKSTASEVGIR